jgi:hypothetical protein
VELSEPAGLPRDPRVENLDRLSGPQLALAFDEPLELLRRQDDELVLAVRFSRRLWLGFLPTPLFLKIKIRRSK